MKFLRTLFWVVVAVSLVIFASRNWGDVTLNLWGNIQADIKLPFLLLVIFLLGFLPPYMLMRSRLWNMKRRLALAERPVIPAADIPTAKDNEETMA
ncbi:MAG: hypothetical protein LOX97_11775 [Sphingomonas sp.]|nr:hypothetical protein [Sphingomonas sp.]